MDSRHCMGNQVAWELIPQGGPAIQTTVSLRGLRVSVRRIVGRKVGYSKPPMCTPANGKEVSDVTCWCSNIETPYSRSSWEPSIYRRTHVNRSCALDKILREKVIEEEV
jgi:hypothetical protein